MADVKTRELGKIVKKRLIELEMTQVQLANILGTSPQELCRAGPVNCASKATE